MAEEKQTRYTIGELVELPSHGLIYDKKVNPIITLRSMNGWDEMKRQNPNSTKTQMKKLADLIEGCMVEKPAISVYDMCIADYQFLLHKLRVITYGNGYPVNIACPRHGCHANIETVANLDTLPIIEIDIDKWNEARTITLPKSGNVVTLNFQTPRMLDENEARTKELKRKYASVDVSWDMFVIVQSVIDTVDGNKLSQTELEEYIKHLDALDLRKIINASDNLNQQIGIINDLVVDCHNCGGEVHTSFRYDAEFFGPSNI